MPSTGTNSERACLGLAVQAAKEVRTLARKLAEADPKRAERYKANSEAFVARLESLHRRYWKRVTVHEPQYRHVPRRLRVPRPCLKLNVVARWKRAGSGAVGVPDGQNHRRRQEDEGRGLLRTGVVRPRRRTVAGTPAHNSSRSTPSTRWTANRMPARTSA